ncbi:hypothetical protein, partial [Rhizobium sp. Pop5]|uniref:hypothetical protein n=1 Tax=Rhizobium sp. Pop5 TaxID=1223565 RepID=UPI001969E842
AEVAAGAGVLDLLFGAFLNFSNVGLAHFRLLFRGLRPPDNRWKPTLFHIFREPCLLSRVHPS